ncbi:MAG: hypothetical protein J7574_15940 [Flavobacterium sp.]|uniref:hypothetical protein n=1 Tax=Flavobacterium sp. TaxID=239 RepID=UPI001B11FE15|nr:hypothetical protein [Flavobacterium sp.]MBO9585657.1 hypothetical protein [Flavobacterium sp.]
MIKDFLISFTDNFKEKTKNPFLGTYLLVWSVRNWELIYTLFNFDKNSTLHDKKSFIFKYYKDNTFIDNLLINILWAFGLLILTYILLNLSRLIVNFSEKQLTPLIYKITDSKSIVLKTEYERIRSENDDLQVRLDKEREAKSRLEIRIKNLENEIIEVTKVNAEGMREQSGETVNQKTVVTSSEILLQKLKERKLLKDFLYICTQINKGNAISNSIESTDKFIELGLIKFLRNAVNSAKMYTITADGESLLQIARLEE